jgi:hypothetical protein
VKVNVIIIFTSTVSSDQQKHTCAVTEATDARKATTADPNFMVDFLFCCCKEKRRNRGDYSPENSFYGRSNERESPRFVIM